MEKLEPLCPRIQPQMRPARHPLFAGARGRPFRECAVQQGMVSPVEADMKAIDKNRFRMFLGDDAGKVL